MEIRILLIITAPNEWAGYLLPTNISEKLGGLPVPSTGMIKGLLPH
jgi:hypothetical protein